MSALDILSWILIVLGGFFCVTGAVGLLRFPDFYTRVHAGGITDTLGATLTLTGLLLQAETFAVAVKLVTIGIVLHVTIPTGTHALVKAAHSRGVRVPSEPT